MKKPSKKAVVKKVKKTPTISYRFPPALIERIKYAHGLEVKGKIVQVSENTFVIHILDKALPHIPKKAV